MENGGQLDNNEQDTGVNRGDNELIYPPVMEEYDMNFLIGDEDHLNNDQAMGGKEPLINLPDMEEYDMDDLLEDEDDHLNTDQAMGGEEHNINTGSSSKPVKRFTVGQLQQLESSFQECTHPDDEMRKELAAKVGIETRQVRFWFQNRRTQVKAKSYGTENNEFRQQKAELLTENMELQEQLKEMICGRCRDPTSEKWQVLDENDMLRGMCSRAYADLIKVMQEANLPPSVTLEDLTSLVTSMNPFSISNADSSSTNNQVTLFSYVECAIKEFETLARNGPPLWLPTIGGDILNSQEYACQGFPTLLGLRPQGFVVEATRDTALVRGTASDVVAILTDVPLWFETFPGIVASLRAYHVVFSGTLASGYNGLIQEINVDLSVESPRPPLRSMKFLRISKQTADGGFVVVDVSINGVHGVHEQESSQNKHTSCRLLPSGCLVQDIGDGYCQVTWIVHAEYEEATVPPLFRQFFQSGQAYGASRWLASLQMHCEYMALMHSIQVPSGCGSVGATISALGRRNLLELAQRMMVNFYKTTSGMATVEPGNIVTGGLGGYWGTNADTVEPAVRMVFGKYFSAMDGEPSPPLQVLSATTTVWLPGTPPERVFSYLCNGQRRGEWDTFVCAGGVQELSSVATSPHLRGNVVSVLCPNVTNAGNNTMLLLQQTSIDVSHALVVYSHVEKTMIHSVMGGGNNTSSLVLLPSGFAILPDGHGKACHHAAANDSSSALAGNTGTAGCLLTAAFQVHVPFNNLGHPDAQATYENAGKRICYAIEKIRAAVGADIVVPT